MLLFLLGCVKPLVVTADVRVDGFELFTRTWIPHDPLSPDGDGLGPYFNEDSCADCHALAGPGGAGPASVNVHLFVANDGSTELEHRHKPESSGAGGTELDPAMAAVVRANRFNLAVQRNAPALFGAALIDAIEPSVFEEVAASQPEEIQGTFRYDTKGRIGRFGWRGQTASLAEFVEGACAGELGLQTPRITQPGTPGPGLDMDEQMLAELVNFVRSLPAPRPAASAEEDPGAALFEDVGCADCHVRDLGGVEGLYSDLLNHDLGPALEDRAKGYYHEEKPLRVTGWKTAPLWGLRDSAPYLHDGRADTIKEAILAHDGQGSASRQAFQQLSPDARLSLLRFLESLNAPPEAL